MNKIIVAPKREFRELVGPNWQEEILKMKGVSVIVRDARQLRIEATSEALEELNTRLRTRFNIEPMVMHHKLA